MPSTAQRGRPAVRGRYESATTTDDNTRLWSGADGLSARAANSIEVRRILRNRARYVRGNSSCLEGITQTLANDTIGTGPRLRLLTKDRELNRRVSVAFEAWSAAIGLAEKLRTMRMSRVIDGEGFGFLITNPKLPTPVKLDIRTVEADQVSTPTFDPLDPFAVDGIEFDNVRNPTFYHLLPSHPGDFFTFLDFMTYDRIPADLVLHWFRVDRPGQVRGVPDITSAISDFAEHVRWNRAVLAAAETAADFAAILYSELPPDRNLDVSSEGESFPIEKREMTVLPSGWKMGQFEAQQPVSTHGEYDRVSIRRIVRCLNMPLNVALGDSSGYNYSSGRLDHQVYHRSIGVDRYALETAHLDRILAVWLAEARRVDPELLDGLIDDPWSATPYHCWRWDGFKHVDPEKEANADKIQLQNGTTSLTRLCAENGDDFFEILYERAEERDAFLALDMPYPGDPPASAPSPQAGPTDPNQAEPDNPPSADAMMRNRDRIAASSEPTTLRAEGMPVQIEAAKGEGKRPTFSIVGYTGAPMSIFGFFSPVIVDLVGMRAASQEIPALRDHDTGRIVGQTDSIQIGKDVKLAGFFTGGTPDSNEIIGHARDGFKWQASIGADIVRREFIESGKTATVNGREVTGPMVVARETVLREISFVAIGADGATSASVAASVPSTPSGSPAMNFDQWLAAKGFDPAALNDAQRAYLRAQFDSESRITPAPAPVATPVPAPVQAAAPVPAPAPAPTVDPNAALNNIFATARADRERRERINAMAEAAITDRPMLIETIEALARSHVENNLSADHFDVALLRLRAESHSAGFAVHSRTQQALNGESLESTICRSIGLRDLERHYSPKTLEASNRQFRHGIGLKELLQLAARENGHGGISLNNPQALLEAALPPRQIQAQAFSTISLPGILSNVANKFIVDAFNAVEQSWRQIAAIRPVNDFKAITSYSLTGNLMLEKITPTGEIAHGTLGEVTYTNQAETYAKMLAITRTDIINDDLGAFAKVPTKLGRGAALKLNDVFWTVFLAGVGSFWTSGRANLISGGTTVLSSGGLEEGTTKYNLQTDPDGFPLGSEPRILLIPTQLEITAAQLMNSTIVNTGGASTVTLVPNANVWQSKYRVVASRYLSNSNYTGYSTTAWYLLADPSDLPTVEVAFLNGREMPIVENAEAEFTALGIMFRAIHDFGVALQEYRGSVRSAGA